MTRKTQREVLATPEWEWWQESINSIPDADKEFITKSVFSLPSQITK